MLAVYFDVGDIVLEDSWNVNLCALRSSAMRTPVNQALNVNSDRVRLRPFYQGENDGRHSPIGAGLTSGNVPFEKTLYDDSSN
jgi:hypothetical protein